MSDKIDLTFPVAEDRCRLTEIDMGSAGVDLKALTDSMAEDKVVLIHKVNPDEADKLILQIVDKFGLRDSLETKAAYAAIQGHRRHIGKYFMSVNARADYQFIPPHSEGGRASDVQLASLYCYENSTDGGESVLFNVNDSGIAWNFLRYVTLKIRLTNKQLSLDEINAAKVMLDIKIPEDILTEADHIIGPCELDVNIPGVTIFEVLENTQKHFSKILRRSVNVYWDNVASTDFDSAIEYYKFLAECNLLRMPPGGLAVEVLDGAADRRVWSSGVKFGDLFSCKLSRKLMPGEMIVFNNLTWAHSAANWTPASGVRKIAASFA